MFVHESVCLCVSACVCVRACWRVCLIACVLSFVCECEWVVDWRSGNIPDLSPG